MGSIIGSKVRQDNKVIFEICLNQEEALQLKGEIDDISMIPGNLDQINTNIVQRGKNEATMYFLIPKTERDTLKNKDKAKFQKVNIGKKTLFIYTVENE